MDWFLLTMRLSGFPIKKAQSIWSDISKTKVSNFVEWQTIRRWKIVQHHIDTNTFYRKRCMDVLTTDWSSLPVLTKKDFQYPLEFLLSSEYPNKRTLYIGNTSGSSGHPFFFAKDKLSHALSWVQIQELYNLYGITVNSRQARFYGIPLSGIGFYKEKLKDLLFNRVRFPVFDLSDTILQQWVETFRKTRFDYLYGYTSSLVYFARYCISKKIVLNEISSSIRVCIVTSEVCTPEDRIILEKGFGVPIVNEYGASETGVIAFERENGNWQVCDELLYLEVVDDRGYPVTEGQPGKILLTVLFNKAMPIIRYEIGDIGVIRRENNGVTVLKRLDGRVNDFVRLPSGKVAPGLTFYYISRSILENAGFIREFIIRQTALDSIVFIIVANRSITEREIALIREKMDTYLEQGLNLRIEQVDRIDRTGAGKIKHFYSLLNL